MPSPFPGMDPYLEDEKYWPSFQQHLVASLYQVLMPSLINTDRMDRYRARVGQRRYIVEMPLFTSVLREEHVEEFVEIRQRSDGQLVTLIDIPSPTNKTRTEGREAYLARRHDAQREGANLVEIDLVLQGQPLLDYSRENLPEWNYLVTVVRRHQPERYEIYSSTIRKRLPRFKLPLAASEHDAVVDLQIAFNRAYDSGGFGNLIDYDSPPKHVQTDADLRWIDDLLVEANVRRR